MKSALLALGLAGAFHGASADIYMQGMRGSNNRLDEANRDRANGNRLFDSQNNNRGGYNVGSVYYYDGSQVPIEWTNQHSCGNENNHCEVIMQYMCDPLIRDGTTTNTIPTKNSDCANYNCDTDVEYGRQESWEWYYSCLDRERNQGLFTANQNLKGDAAIYTRQNPNGNRRGYECPEERDYYPYWNPSPWKDIAVYTNEPERCTAYRQESQNVKDRWSCVAPEGLVWYMRERGQRGWLPITETECEELEYFNEALNTTEYGSWTRTPSFGMAAPYCGQSAWSRDNHHGNSVGGFMVSYNWTVPSEIISDQCIFRIRYNISTYDFEAFEDITSVGPNADDNNATYNRENKNANDDPSYLPLWEKFFLDYSDVADSFDESINDDDDALTGSREYVLKNDPNVDMFGTLLGDEKAGLLKVQIAVNTAQFGRTFQDRSHTFGVKKRPAELNGRTIVNIQVRGKRGNIVQVYPGVEYDFQPNRVHVTNGDFVHFQWTGSNTNPNNNAGQGKAGTDRSNVIVQAPPNYAEGQQTDTATYGHWGNNYPGTVDDSFLGLRRVDKEHLAVLTNMQYGGEMSELDDAGTYFDLGPRQVSQMGIFHYVSTRNNNFSNRSQKGKIVVGNEAVYTQQVGAEGARIEAGNVIVTVPTASLNEATIITVSRMSTDDEDHLSEIVNIQPDSWNGGEVSLAVPFDSYHSPKLSHSSNGVNGEWEGVDDVEYHDNVASAMIGQGGLYVVEKGSRVNIAAAVLIPIFTIGFAVVFYAAYQKRTYGHYGYFQRFFDDAPTSNV